jgi:hypothetical protein
MVPEGERYLNRVVVMLGLLATGWFIWTNSIGPRIGRAPLELLIGRAIGQVLVAGVCGEAIAMCAYLTVLWTGRGRVRNPLRSALIATWYLPAMVLMFALTPLSVAAGAVLVFATTRVMVARWDRNRAPLPVSVSALLLKRLAVALACSVAIHLGVAAYARGSTVLAAVLFAGIIATLTSLAMVVGAYAPAKPASLPHSVLGLLLIVLLTVGMRIANRGGGGGAAFDDSGGSSPVPEDSFPGVILLRELEKNAVLIAPNLKQGARSNDSGLFSAEKPATLTQPLDVTFSGEYWMFLPRYRRPPPKSLVERGSPSKLSFSTNGGPMVMEAHQPLDEYIDPASCAAIQLVVAGPATQNLLVFQLFLVDTETFDPRGGEDLGFQFVRGNPSTNDRETLTFAVPAVLRLKRFNEIKMAFRQPGVMNKSIKIEIEKMTIVPR